MGANFYIMARRKIDKRALKVLSEEPESFTIESLDGEDIELHLYPLQLGRLAMISERLINLDMALSEEGDNDVKKMWKICAENPKDVAEIIAISTLRTRQDIEDKLKERTKLILNSPTMTPNAIVNVFMAIIFQSYYADFLNTIRSARTFQVMISPETEMERIVSTEGRQSGAE